MGDPGIQGPQGNPGPAGPAGADGGYLGAYANPPAVEVGKEYYNTSDHKRYRGVATAQAVNTLSFNLTPRAVPSTPGNLEQSGFDVDGVVTYGVSPLTGWRALKLQIDRGGAETQFYLEAETSQGLFSGLSMQVGAAQFTFRRDSSTSAGGDIWTSNDVSAAPWGFNAVAVVVHSDNAPFTSTVNQWHWLPQAGEDNSYNALTGASYAAGTLTFPRHTGAALGVDIPEPASWAEKDNTDFIPASKIELTQTLIDGTGIGITSAGGQSARGPLRLFAPTFDLDDPDKQRGIIYVRVNLAIVDADATTSFAADSVVRQVTQTARIRASVMRQDDNEYSAAANQGERVGDAVTVYRGGVAVGTPALYISRNSDKELGYFVDWARQSGASAIEFQLLNYSVEFTHNDVSDGGGVGVSQDPEILVSLSANESLRPNTNNVMEGLRYTVPAGKAGRYIIEFKASVDIRNLVRQSAGLSINFAAQTFRYTDADETIVYMVVRGNRNKEYAFNAHLLHAPDGQRTLDAEGFGILAEGEVVEPFIGLRGDAGTVGPSGLLGVVNMGINTYLRMIYLG